MFSLLKLIIWIAGILAVAYFVLGYFGYTFNLNYFQNSKAACQQKIQECTNNLVHQGLDNVKCDVQCVNAGLIIKKN
jgi:hypothetical protein